MNCGDGSKAPPLLADHPAARGLAALRTGRPELALELFESLIAAEPSGLAGHVLRAEALERLGRVGEARASLESIAERFPFAAGACFERLAALAVRAGDRAAALGSLERALAAGWTNADAITGEPSFEPFRGDPGFESVLERARR